MVRIECIFDGQVDTAVSLEFDWDGIDQSGFIPPVVGHF